MWSFFLVLLAAIAGSVYKLTIHPLLLKLGYGRVLDSIGNTDCISLPQLQACEKIVLHQPSGVIYLACSTPSRRTTWMPAVARFNASGASPSDYVATYDPASSRITRLEVVNFDSERGLSLHGMDVVPSSADPSVLFVYLVNHRPPLQEQSASFVGADSSIEVFKTTAGSDTLTHIRTVESPVIRTPNDVVGLPDGESFYFTNDHGEKVGMLRELDFLGRFTSSVGYCHLDDGCKYAISRMHGNNGITRAQNDTFYVANSFDGAVTVLERQSDNTLVVLDVIKTDRGLDNLSIDSNGVLWAAGFPHILTFVFKHLMDPSVPSPSSAHRISMNTGPTSFYGMKYKVEKVFEDDGSIASGSTSVVHDAQRRLLFLHGTDKLEVPLNINLFCSSTRSRSSPFVCL